MYWCESCGHNAFLCEIHMNGIHSSMNLTHHVSRWRTDCQIPHFERHVLARTLRRSPVAARACSCPVDTDTAAQLVVIGMTGCDTAVSVQCCSDQEHLPAWLVLQGLWPIITGRDINFAIAIIDIRWLTQVASNAVYLRSHWMYVWPRYHLICSIFALLVRYSSLFLSLSLSSYSPSLPLSVTDSLLLPLIFRLNQWSASSSSLLVLAFPSITFDRPLPNLRC